MSVQPKISGKTRVLWLTNIATPYRIPAWQAVSSEVDLTMALLSNTEQNRWWDIGSDEIGIPVHFLDVKAIRYGERSLYLPSKSLRKLFRQDFDVLILGGWESPAYLYSLRIAKKRGIKTISHYGSTKQSHKHANGIVDRIRSWFYGELDAHFSYGTDAANSLVSMGINRESIFTGFNSVDHEYFNRETAVLRNAHDPVPGHNYLYVGQLLERKNVESLISAFKNISTPQDKLQIVGSGPLMSELQKGIDEIGMGHNVQIVGPKLGASLLDVYANAQTLVLPSTNEVWGLVVNEALASGLHVVVTKSCGATEDVKDMQGVFTCDTSVEDIGAKMAASRSQWSGYISAPEILKFTPDHFAKTITSAIRFALDN